MKRWDLDGYDLLLFAALACALFLIVAIGEAATR